MPLDAFPLQWPPHIRRTPESARNWGGFQVTPDRATRDLLEEVRRSGGSNVVISTNRPVRKDGMPMQSAREPDDPGVAVYFRRKGRDICIACDAFDRVWKNIRAIGLSIRDMRGPESRGCAQITDQAFTGFAALPHPGAVDETGRMPWWVILDVPPDASPDDIRAAYKGRAREAGGATVELNAARDTGLSARGDR